MKQGYVKMISSNLAVFVPLDQFERLRLVKLYRKMESCSYVDFLAKFPYTFMGMNSGLHSNVKLKNYKILKQ